MPPRYSYWTIIAGGLPTAFRAAERDELLPTYSRLREKHPDAEMKWFARGRLWESPEAAAEARARSEDHRRPAGEPRGADWRPGGTHRDPRQPYKDAKKERNQRWRQERHDRREQRSDAKGGRDGRPVDSQPPVDRPRREDTGTGRRPPVGPPREPRFEPRTRQAGDTRGRDRGQNRRPDRPGGGEGRPREGQERYRPQERHGHQDTRGARPPRHDRPDWQHRAGGDAPRGQRPGGGHAADRRPPDRRPQERRGDAPPAWTPREQRGPAADRPRPSSWDRDTRAPRDRRDDGPRRKPFGGRGGGDGTRPSSFAPRDRGPGKPSFAPRGGGEGPRAKPFGKPPGSAAGSGSRRPPFGPKRDGVPPRDRSRDDRTPQGARPPRPQDARRRDDRPQTFAPRDARPPRDRSRDDRQPGGGKRPFVPRGDRSFASGPRNEKQGLNEWTPRDRRAADDPGGKRGGDDEGQG